MIATFVSLLGCSGEPTRTPPTTTPPTGDTGATTPTHTGTPPGPDLVVTAAQDPGLSLTMSLTTQEIRAGFDPLVTWTTLTTDAWGDPIVATAAGTLVLFEVLEPPATVGERLARDDIFEDLIAVWSLDAAGLASAHLSDLHAGPTAFDTAAFLVENPAKSWVLGLAHDDGVRLDLRVATVLVPIRNGSGSAVSLTDASASFTWSAGQGAPLLTSSRWDLWTVDWSALTTDLVGKPMEEGAVDEVSITRHPAGTDLSAKLIDLPAASDASWRLEVSGFTDVRLDLALDPTGKAFPGFTAGHVWAISGRCSYCMTRFPVWTARVDVQ
ncbi:MAG: hypothetical protein H6738_04575 [Alphaproteobacteria bacterium]|nr:hypothetical protein [Alphaproteobacteria bacterium]MCB9696048.1 hypothetical protein [Alphaproteobacteria bacterium]